MLTALKAKDCAGCGKPFMPRNSFQTVCFKISCARKKLANDERVERAETKRRKEAIKTIPDLIREAQVAFNAYIRARDEKKPCISCGKSPGDMTELHAGRDAGHYRSTGSAAHLRFHEDNCHSQCVKCNQWKAGNAVDYRLGLVARIGPCRVQNLESDNLVHKWTRAELIELKATYRRKLKELKA